MAEKLKAYNQKRNFDKTVEPEGNAELSGEVLRFVVQHHMARREHYDLRLEWRGVLLSWAVPKGPSYNTRDKRLAVMVEDHPLEYRNFEGTIPKGQYGGGVVMLWDEGFWEPQGNVEKGLFKGELKFVLMGRRLKGRWVLVRLKPKPGEDKDNWLLIKERDEYIKEEDGISAYSTSIRSGRSMDEIERGESDKITRNPFSKVEVQLARLVHSVPVNGEWLYELKYDGYRIVAFVEGNNVRLVTRNGNDLTERFHAVASSLAELAEGRAMILDGEVAITDELGRTDFQALQSYMKKSGKQSLTYIVFDLLAMDGVDLRGRCLIERKEILEKLLEHAPGNIHYSRHIAGNGKESFAAACEAGMEGIIGKKADSEYSGSRNQNWIKLKCERRQEFVIGGYVLTDKKKSGVSSLLLGVYEGDELIYAGRAGTGISEAGMRALESKFASLTREVSPFGTAPKPGPKERLTWLEPNLVAEIKFAEWTRDGHLRQASFKGLRGDKDPRTIKRESAERDWQSEFDEGAEMNMTTTISGTTTPIGRAATSGTATASRTTTPTGTSTTIGTTTTSKTSAKAASVVIEGVKITNPGKVLFQNPLVTKEEVIRYYAAISERMLPYVRRRIITSVRCPKGVSENCFYKKHPGPGSKGVVPFPVTNSSGKTDDYFYIQDAAGLIHEAQMGTLEFHTWGSSIDELDKPDIMVFDLDPDEGMELGRIRQGAKDIKSILAELSLNSYLKTSGGKGYHVVVPFKPVMDWEAFNDFAKTVAQVMEQKWPDRYTSNVRKAKRADKIFIDWIRNGRGATSIAPYSLRAREGASVSMPIAWEELDTIAPDGIKMADALRRLGGNDPWRDFFKG
jgi:bifunctional non-homologous end joining protein LigD